MKRENSDAVKQAIVHAADDLFYKKGFNNTSFKDVAIAAGLLKGNIYYYFKTKDALLTAVIAERLMQMQHMLADWEQALPNPLERLQRYTQIPLRCEDEIIAFGCPMGSLNTELGKAQATLQIKAKQQFEFFHVWLTEQFQAYLPGRDVAPHVFHLLIWTQGIAVISQTYHDVNILRKEVADIHDWLTGLASRTVK